MAWAASCCCAPLTPASCLEFCWLSLCLPAYTHVTSESKKKLHLSSFLFNWLVENVQTSAVPRVYPVGTVAKNLPANAGDERDAGLIPGLGRSPGGGHGNLLQYSCLENPMGRGAWWATVCGITKSQTRLSTHTHTHTHTHHTAVPVPASGTEERQTLIPPGPPRHPDAAKLHVCVVLCPLPS